MSHTQTPMSKHESARGGLSRVVISGGGTGGHIFPAISIANEIRRRYPTCHILFVGANGRMEIEKVPEAGYEIMTLPIRGIDRHQKWKNVKTIYLLLKSLVSVRKLLAQLRPEIVIGVGGYASAPTLMVAQWMGIPTLVQEQNSYAGLTNKLVGKRAKAVCVAYKGMDRFFPKERIHLTGNPVRRVLLGTPRRSTEAYQGLGLDPAKQTLVIIGGSLGAKTINQSVTEALQRLSQTKGLQVLWQTGKGYLKKAQAEASKLRGDGTIIVTDFIYRMDWAFAVADLLISRAGAGSISELSLLGIPAILVPSPNVAEDHQTKNAQSLVKEGAAVMVPDAEAHEKLIDTALMLLKDKDQLNSLSLRIKAMALPESADRIVDMAEEITHKDTHDSSSK